MATWPRTQLTVAVVVLLGIATAGDPASSLHHALEHVAPAGTAETHRGGPNEVPGAHCDVCQSLSQMRAALTPTAQDSCALVSVAGATTRFVTQCLSIRASHTPDSPRAPPLG